MDEKIAKYLKTYGLLAGMVVLIVVLGELGFVKILTTLLIFICILLVGVILIQQSKGGGLVGALGGMSGDTMFGTTATPVKKFTAALGLLFILCVIMLARANREAMMARRTPPPAPPTREAPMPMPMPPTKAPTTPTPGSK